MPEQLLKRLPFLGLLVGLLYWVLDAFVDVSFFGIPGSFREALLSPSGDDLWMRSVVLVLMLAFAWYARRAGMLLIESMNQLKDREQELNSQRDQQHVLKRQTDELSRQVMRQETEQEELRKLAYNDPLTGLYNRRRIEEILDASRLTEELRHTGLAALLCDIDHFKSVNDQFGHIAGDQIIVRISRSLTDHFRRGDAIGRWGGEKFLIILPNITLPVAEVISENLRARVERESHPPKGRLTVSLGLAMLQEGESAESLVQRADRALMMAKQNGRNRLYICRSDGKANSGGQDCLPFQLTT